MKRVLVAAALGGLLMVGTPTLAMSAQRNDTKAEKSADNKGGDNKGGNKGGDNKGGDRGDRGHRGDRDDRGDRGDRGHRGDRDHDGRDRHGYHRGDRYYYGGGYWYGEPQDCWYGPSGAYNCEPYGGDYYGGGYHPGYSHYGTQNRNVYVERHAFNPGEVHAGVGQEVLWIFRDSEAHTVTADNKSFDSGQVRQGEFRLIFEQPGTYSYHCAIHPEIKGRVVIHG